MIVGDEAVLSVRLRSALDPGGRRCLHADDVEHDVILAVHEAAANAIEHAYPSGDTNGHVELTFWLDGGNLCLSVADHGEWRGGSARRPRPRPGPRTIRPPP